MCSFLHTPVTLLLSAVAGTYLGMIDLNEKTNSNTPNYLFTPPRSLRLFLSAGVFGSSVRVNIWGDLTAHSPSSLLGHAELLVFYFTL